MNEKNVRTTLDNTSVDIQEARDDNGCDDVEEEDNNEDEDHGEGPACCSRNAAKKLMSENRDMTLSWRGGRE